MNSRAEFLNQIGTREGEILKLLSDLVQCPSENPPGDTRGVAQFVIGYLQEKGFTSEIVAPQPSMANVVASIEGHAPGRHMILNGHMDTFPVGNRIPWEMDPFSGLISEDRIYGRGVSDMKAGVAASITSFCLLGKMRKSWRGRVTLALVCDEETFGPWGANYLVDHYPKLRGDAVIIGEPTSPKIVRFGEKGFLWIRLTARGQSAHAAYPNHGCNAILALAKILGELMKLESMEWLVAEDFLRTIDQGRFVTDDLLGKGTTDVLSSVTVNLGTIRGGIKINLVADSCEAEVEIRIPPGILTPRILSHIGRMVREQRGVTYEVINRSEPNYTRSDHELFTIITRNVIDVRGESPVLNISSPATDSRVFRRVGIPVAVYGPRPYNLAAANEYVTAEDYLNTVRVHALSALDFLTTEDASCIRVGNWGHW